jgi:hypothetical protein
MMKNFVSAGLGIIFCGNGLRVGSVKVDLGPCLLRDPTAGGKVPPVILGRKEVPILCYHQIRDWKPTDSKVSKDYIMPPADLKAELKMLADSGYHTILPDQLYAYLTKGAALPSKPIMLTFDDTDEDQYTVAWPEMKKYGFQGCFLYHDGVPEPAAALYE